MPAAELGEGRLATFFAFVFGNAVERMDAHEDLTAFVLQFDEFLQLAIDGRFYESAKLTDTMIHMHHVIAHLQLVELLERKQYLTFAGGIRPLLHLVIPLENLMVGKTARPQFMVDESRVKGGVNGRENAVFTAVIERIFKRVHLLEGVQNGTETVSLLAAVRKDIHRVTSLAFGSNLIEEKVEILSENGLRLGVKIDYRM